MPAARFNAPRGRDEAILSPAQLASSSPSSSICSWEKYPKEWPAPGIGWLVMSTASGSHDLPIELRRIERGVYYSTKPVKAKTATRRLGSPATPVLSPYSLHGAAALPGRSTGRTVVGRRIRRRIVAQINCPARTVARESAQELLVKTLRKLVGGTVYAFPHPSPYKGSTAALTGGGES
jgi:hypothetical protein